MELPFDLLVDSLPNKIWVTDSLGTPVFFNKRWVEYTGISLQQRLSGGVNCWDVVHPDDREVSRTAWQLAVATGDKYEIEYRLRNKDGAYRWHIVRGAPLYQDGKLTYWVGSCADNDDRVIQKALAKAYDFSGASLDSLQSLLLGLRDITHAENSLLPTA
jgi:PAS domain S-box-containing protein